MKDRWTVEYAYEGQDNWQIIGIETADLEEATNWLSVAARLHTEIMVRADGTTPLGHRIFGNYKTIQCSFRLHNLESDEIIPGEVFIET